MRRHDPGYLILLVAGWTLLLGTLAGALIRWLVDGSLPPSPPDALVWAFGLAIPLAVLGEIAVILWRAAWRRGRLRWRRPRSTASLPKWIGVCMLCGAALGVYSGGLGDKPGPQVGYLGLLPLLLVAMLLRAHWHEALVRLLAFFLPLEVFAQLVGAWAQRGRFGYWDDITVLDVGFLLGGAAFWGLQALLAYRRRHVRDVMRQARIRPSEGQSAPAPRAAFDRVRSARRTPDEPEPRAGNRG